MYNNGKTVPGKKPFASYELVLEIGRGLWDCQKNINQIKNDTNEVYDLEVYFKVYNR